MSKETFIVTKISMLLREAFMEDIHPTKVILDVIQEVYGHKIDMEKFIDLLEGSPLASDEIKE